MNTWNLGGIIYIYILYRLGDRTETCGSRACISLGVDISPSTETLNFLFERKELMSLIFSAENFNVNNVYSRPGCQDLSDTFFDIHEYHLRRHVFIEI
jgi:hypothetical protein